MVMNDVFKIAVVIVNWNRKADILNLLSELKTVSKPCLDVIVVDNASEDGSVAAIKTEFPETTLIINKVNTGGTGGFNQGIRYVIGQKKYRYVWLLDNDARIEDHTIGELLNAMESDSRIGIAGSRIVDIENRVMTVETGGNFRWDIAGVAAVNRNCIPKNLDAIDVDYVAICSALVRLSALERVGLMDERLFVLWDDMDWGLCFKSHGYQVVSIPKSIVYHRSFSERSANEIMDFYYNFRNALLVYTKHTNFKKRTVIFYRTMRFNIRIYLFLVGHDRKYAGKLMLTALKDYLNNRWGKFVENIHCENNRYGKSTGILDTVKPQIKKILVPVMATAFKDSKVLLKELKKKYPEAEIRVLANDDRSGLYEEYNPYKLKKKKLKSLLYLLQTFIRLKHEKYDCVAAITPSPFIYIAKQTLFFQKDAQTITLYHSGPVQFMKLCLLLCGGEILALVLWPLLMLKSRRYEKKF